jgi:hypothetical protein
MAVRELREPGTLPEFFLVEEQSIRLLLDVMSKPDGRKPPQMLTSTIVCLKP